MDDTGILTNDGRLGIHEEGRSSTLKCLLIYTGCFIVLCFFVYFLFITDGRTLVRYLTKHADSFEQKYVFVFELKRFLDTLFQNGEINTWDWTIGLGTDGYAFNVSSMLCPAEYIQYLTPGKYVDIVSSLMIISRVYVSGAGFVLFAKKIGLSDCQTIMGAIAYTFSPWIIVMTIYQASLVKASLVFPFIMLGEEKLIRRESPLLFILSVGYTVFTVFSFAYIIAFIVLLYFPVRMLTDGRTRTADIVIKTTIILFLSGIAGIMLAGESFVITLMKFGETSGASGNTADLFWSVKDYLRMPMRLMTWDMVFGASSIIAIAAIGVIMVPMIAYKAYRRETDSIMTVLMFIFVLFPFFSRMFNFFSYPTGRWMFALIFFYALAAAECFDKELLMRKESKVAITAVFAMYAVYIMWIQKICDDMNKIILLFSCVVCTLMIVVIWIYFRPSMDSQAKQKAAGIAVIAIMCAGIIFNYNVMFYPEYENYLKIGQGQEEMNKSPQRAAQGITDDDFYRVDQAKTTKLNAQMYFGNRSEYVYYSYIDVGWIQYNKLLGNNQGYCRRVRVQSNDNRFGLDFLQGVRYFMGNYEGHSDLSQYAGFGYEPYKTIDGVDVLKNKYNIGIGCMFDSYIRRAEWEKLSFADREYAMLMGIMVPDDEEMPSSMSELMADDIKSGVEEVPYEISANKGNTEFVISCDNDDEHQLLMSFSNVQAAGEKKFKLKVDNGVIEKTVSNTRGDDRGYPEETMRDLTVNLGSGEKAGSEIKVKLSGDDAAMASGVSFDDVKIYSMPLETYRKCAEKLVDNRLNVTRFTNDHITGTVKTDKPQTLYLSIFDNNGWDVYVDGKKADVREEVDLAFIGTDIEPGEHEVDIIYHSKGALEGLLVTLAGVILTVFIMLMWKKQSAAEQSV